MNATGLTVLVVDPEPRARLALVQALGRLGMHAIGAFAPIDAVALLDGICAEVVVVRGDDPDAATAYLRNRTMLVQVPLCARITDAVAAVLEALGQPADYVCCN